MIIEKEFRYYDPLDLDDYLEKVEESFNIKFDESELLHLSTVDEFSEYVANKIELQSNNGCTSQQAFYKLRVLISDVVNIKNEQISPKTSLEHLFAKNNRRKLIKQIEKKLNLKFSALKAPEWISLALRVLILVSFGLLFFQFKYSLLLLTFLIVSIYITDYFGNEFSETTVGDLTKKMMREHYVKSRKNPRTFNKNEIKKIVSDLFKAQMTGEL